MILVLKKAWAASSMISLLNLDSAIFSLSCLIPVPPVFGVPFKSMILSALFLTPSPFFSLATSSLTTSNSPLKRVSFSGFILYWEWCRHLEFLEQTSCNTSSGCSRETNLVIDDDGGVDCSSDQGLADSVKICFIRSCRVADWHSPVNKSREFLLQTLDDFTEAFQFLNFNFQSLLVDINSLQFASIVILPHFTLLCKLDFIRFCNISGNISQLSILSNLVGWASTNGLTIDIYNRFLSEVEPDDGFILGIGISTNFVQSCFKSSNCRLATAVNFEAWNSSEVWTSWNWIWKFLDFVKGVSHTGCICHVPHAGWSEQSRIR